jgi:hypothetical protein
MSQRSKTGNLTAGGGVVRKVIGATALAGIAACSLPWHSAIAADPSIHIGVNDYAAQAGRE